MITSVHNTKVKEALALQRARGAKAGGLFVLEGVKEMGLALASGYALTRVFFCPDLIGEETLLQMGIPPSSLVAVARAVFGKLAYRKRTGGAVAIARRKTHRLEDLSLSAKPLLLVAQAVEKPGNLGGLLRTADAAGLDAVILCDMRTDCYHPNVVRSSVGCLFTCPLACSPSAEAIAWMRKKGVTLYGASLQASAPYRTADYNRPCAIVMGSEAEGIDAYWQRRTDQNVKVPMRGKIDSMNVSVTAGIIVFEALRQRGL